jgi:hypothetical protein
MEREQFTKRELEMLFTAWALHRYGKAFRPADVYVPECYRLSERGWLERRWHGDDVVFRWSQHAETTLDLNLLTATYVAHTGAKASTN